MDSARCNPPTRRPITFPTYPAGECVRALAFAAPTPGFEPALVACAERSARAISRRLLGAASRRRSASRRDVLDGATRRREAPLPDRARPRQTPKLQSRILRPTPFALGVDRRPPRARGARARRLGEARAIATRRAERRPRRAKRIRVEGGGARGGVLGVPSRPQAGLDDGVTDGYGDGGERGVFELTGGGGVHHPEPVASEVAGVRHVRAKHAKVLGCHARAHVREQAGTVRVHHCEGEEGRGGASGDRGAGQGHGSGRSAGVARAVGRFFAARRERLARSGREAEDAGRRAARRRGSSSVPLMRVPSGSSLFETSTPRFMVGAGACCGVASMAPGSDGNPVGAIGAEGGRASSRAHAGSISRPARNPASTRPSQPKRAPRARSSLTEDPRSRLSRLAWSRRRPRRRVVRRQPKPASSHAGRRGGATTDGPQAPSRFSALFGHPRARDFLPRSRAIARLFAHVRVSTWKGYDARAHAR